MSVHVLLNLCNKLRKSDKMRGLSKIFTLFRNEFNKSNKTGACLSIKTRLRLTWPNKLRILHECSCLIEFI